MINVIFLSSFVGHYNLKNRNNQLPYCGILKSSFNNRQRRIESLRSFSTLFCSTTTLLKACTKSRRRGIGGASTKNLQLRRKIKSINSEAVGVRCAKKRGSILILLLRGVSWLLTVKLNVLS